MATKPRRLTMTASKEKWIQEAIKSPGALRATAKKAGLIKGEESLTKSDIEQLKKSENKTTARRARLAETLAKLPRARGARKKK